jgi:hypothetical protein
MDPLASLFIIFSVPVSGGGSASNKTKIFSINIVGEGTFLECKSVEIEMK